MKIASKCLERIVGTVVEKSKCDWRASLRIAGGARMQVVRRAYKCANREK